MSATHALPDPVARTSENPDFLDHLRAVYGCSREEASAALGAWILSSRAGRALLRAETEAECNQSVEAA